MLGAQKKSLLALGGRLKTPRGSEGLSDLPSEGQVGS